MLSSVVSCTAHFKDFNSTKTKNRHTSIFTFEKHVIWIPAENITPTGTQKAIFHKFFSVVSAVHGAKRNKNVIVNFHTKEIMLASLMCLLCIVCLVPEHSIMRAAQRLIHRFLFGCPSTLLPYQKKGSGK